MKRTLSLAAAGAILALAEAPPLRAQTVADTPELARAVASVIADSVLARGRMEPVVWRHSHLPLDSAVARLLADDPHFRAPAADSAHTMWMAIREVAHEADAAVVTFEIGQDGKSKGETELPTSWTEMRGYVFERAGTGWRFVQTDFVRNLDAGPVRGR